MNKYILLIPALCLHVTTANAQTLPADFIFLSEFDSSIQQDIRYAGSFNFTVAPVPGYTDPECILHKQAASALSSAQKDFQQLGYTVKVFDCYRPHKATKAFVAWVASADRNELKTEFYPTLGKADLLSKGFISSSSTHSMGTAVDLVLIRPNDKPEITKQRGGGPCDGPYDTRPLESSLDFGTTFDCFTDRSFTRSAAISEEARKNRALLVDVMKKHGFANYAKEWWHFSLEPRPAGAQIMDFAVTSSKEAGSKR